MIPSPAERTHRNEVMQRILDCIQSGTMIKLPAFDPTRDRANDEFALLTVGIEPNDFGGTFGEFRYQFEGEEDLLHLLVTRSDLSELTPEEGRMVAAFLLDGVPPALVWFRPGTKSQHFYVGHDDLIGSLTLESA